VIGEFMQPNQLELLEPYVSKYLRVIDRSGRLAPTSNRQIAFGLFRTFRCSQTP
jgi:hypothetical protein